MDVVKYADSCAGFLWASGESLRSPTGAGRDLSHPGNAGTCQGHCMEGISLQERDALFHKFHCLLWEYLLFPPICLDALSHMIHMTPMIIISKRKM